MKWNLMRLQQPVFLLKDTHCIAEDTIRRSYIVFIPKLKVQVSAQFTQTEILHLDCMFFFLYCKNWPISVLYNILMSAYARIESHLHAT